MCSASRTRCASIAMAFGFVSSRCMQSSASARQLLYSSVRVNAARRREGRLRAEGRPEHHPVRRREARGAPGEQDGGGDLPSARRHCRY